MPAANTSEQDGLEEHSADTVLIHMKTEKTNILIGIVLMALAVFVFVASRPFPPRSQFFVEKLAFFLILLTIIFLAQACMRIKKGRKEEKVEDAGSTGISYSQLIITIVCFAIYIGLLIPLIGFMPATFVTLFAIMYILGLRNIPLLAGVTIFLPLILFLVFHLVLRVPLPPGLLFE